MNLSFTAAERLWSHLLRAIATIVEFAGQAVGALMRFLLWRYSMRFCVRKVVSENRVRAVRARVAGRASAFRFAITAVSFGSQKNCPGVCRWPRAFSGRRE